MTDARPATSYALQTSVAFTAFDGKQFHDLAEARTHVRGELYTRVLADACRDKPDFARLDKDLLVEFLMTHGPRLAKIAVDPFNPAPLPQEKPATQQPAAQAPAIPAARPDASPAPSAARKLMNLAERGLESVRPVPMAGTPAREWPKHPLDNAQGHDADLAQAMERELDIPFHMEPARHRG